MLQAIEKDIEALQLLPSLTLTEDNLKLEVQKAHEQSFLSGYKVMYARVKYNLVREIAEQIKDIEKNKTPIDEMDAEKYLTRLYNQGVLEGYKKVVEYLGATKELEEYLQTKNYYGERTNT